MSHFLDFYYSYIILFPGILPSGVLFSALFLHHHSPEKIKLAKALEPHNLNFITFCEVL